MGVRGGAVMMQQVAKGVLEEARGRGGQPPVPRGSLADSPLEACRTLLHFRCRPLQPAGSKVHCTIICITRFYVVARTLQWQVSHT